MKLVETVNGVGRFIKRASNAANKNQPKFFINDTDDPQQCAYLHDHIVSIGTKLLDKFGNQDCQTEPALNCPKLVLKRIDQSDVSKVIDS